jgi:hypothetical protein
MSVRMLERDNLRHAATALNRAGLTISLPEVALAVHSSLTALKTVVHCLIRAGCRIVCLIRGAHSSGNGRMSILRMDNPSPVRLLSNDAVPRGLQ